MLKVYKKPCKNCLFSKDKIVSDERKDDILDSCIKKNTYFICHKSTIENGKTCYKRFFDKYKDRTSLLRMADRLSMVEMVDLENNIELTPYARHKEV
jgi:hypothetical protein